MRGPVLITSDGRHPPAATGLKQLPPWSCGKLCLQIGLLGRIQKVPDFYRITDLTVYNNEAMFSCPDALRWQRPSGSLPTAGGWEAPTLPLSRTCFKEMPSDIHQNRALPSQVFSQGKFMALRWKQYLKPVEMTAFAHMWSLSIPRTSKTCPKGWEKWLQKYWHTEDWRCTDVVEHQLLRYNAVQATMRLRA